MKELNHLAEIFEKYDTFVIDLWGVVHNGVALNPNAIKAVDQLKKHSKKIYFNHGFHAFSMVLPSIENTYFNLSLKRRVAYFDVSTNF